MPRLPRIDYPDARHHVMNRGARSQPVFWNDESCLLFLDILGDVVERYGIIIHGYALMVNHFHLMVESPRANLSKAMQNLQFRYSQEVNRADEFDGALFRGRFRSKLVIDESHWFYLLMYIHLNPVKARLASSPDQYIWTSHEAYVDARCCPKWLTTKEMNEYFDTDGGYKSFVEAAMSGRYPAPDEFDQILFESKGGARHMLVKQPEVKPELTPEKALEQVAELTGVVKKEIMSTRRGAAGNPTRALSIWWLIRGAGLTNSQVGEMLGISSSGVSKIMRKLRENPSKYFGGQVADWQEYLILKGQ